MHEVHSIAPASHIAASLIIRNPKGQLTSSNLAIDVGMKDFFQKSSGWTKGGIAQEEVGFFALA